MPIQQIEERLSFPVAGKIRLGITKMSQKGNRYPVEVPHFVVDHLPEVKAVYGDTPTSLDAFFLSDDEEKIAPYYYKLWGGGYVDANGDRKGGKLLCKGDGREAQHLANRDPVTRVVPVRQCLAQQCPDWTDSKGRQQCKPQLDLMVWLPLANLGGVYQITTSSWIAIQSVIQCIHHFKRATGGRVTGIPFRLFRKPTETNHIDPKTGKEQKGTHHIMFLDHNPTFKERCSGQLADQMKNLMIPMASVNPPQIQISGPIEEGYAPVDEDEVRQQEIKAQVQGSEVVAEDQELLPLFEQLSALKGKKSTAKLRLLTARKFENAPDQKKALKEYLVLEIKKAGEAGEPVEEEAPKAPEPQQPQTQPEVNSEGLI